MSSPSFDHVTDWPHAPPHRLSTRGCYIVTAGTFQKQHLFHDATRLDCLQRHLLDLAKRDGWQLEAWAVFPNHYHFIARPSRDGEAKQHLAELIRQLHSDTANWLNDQDDTPGRRVWYQYWDSFIEGQASYLARLHYVHRNAVRHGLVEQARDYPWCSAAWFERLNAGAWVQKVYGFKTDLVRVEDDF